MPFAVQLDLDAVARIGDRLPFISAGADPRSRNSAPDWRCSPHLTGGLRGFTRRALRGRFGPICYGARTVGRATRQYRHLYGRPQRCLPRSCPEELLALHRRFHDEFSAFAGSCWGHYRRGYWVPHVTLGMNAGSAALQRAAVEIMKSWKPTRARLDVVRLVRFRPVETIYRFALSSR